MSRIVTAPGCRAALAFALGMPLAAASQGTPHNVDTGVRKNQCYRSAGDALVACATTDLAAQDGAVGRDTYGDTRGNADGTLGFSFVRICMSGRREGEGHCPVQPLPGDGKNDWACTEDEVTGMMWEVKALSGPRARDLRYTNYSREYDPVGQYRSSTDASGFVDGINRTGLCGFVDWHLSHSDKIQTVVDYGVATSGALRADDRYLPTMNADWYWNASPNPTSPSTAFALDFGSGVISNTAERGTLRYVQVVRNGDTVVGPHGRYELSADGTEVRDTTVGAMLTWRRCAEGMAWDGRTCAGTPTAFTQEQALVHAAQEAAAGGEPWRVPSVKELNWLVQRKLASPAIDHGYFPATPPVPTWTSTPEVRLSSSAWAVDFDLGQVGTAGRDTLHVLRLARDPE
jgi:hypothetical protein